MTDLPAIRKPSSIQPGQPAEDGFPFDLSALTVDELRQLVDALTALVAREKNDPHSSAAMKATARQMRSRAVEQLRRVTAAHPPEDGASPAAAVTRDKISTGDVAPGANVGSGTSTINGGAAGRNIIRDVGTVIDQPITFIFNGKEPAAEDASISDLERDYLRWLITVANRVPLGELDLQRPPTAQTSLDVRLDSIYVTLDIMRTQRALQRGENPDDRVPVPALDAVMRARRLVILGDPGSGKSTFLNFLTLCLAGARLYPKRGFLERLNIPQEGRRRAVSWRYGDLLPVRIDLREFVRDIEVGARRGTATMLWKHIVNQLAMRNLADFATDLQAALRGGRALVLFDGLDEIPDLKHRQIVRDAIGEFADCYGRSRFIVTCRVLSYTDPAWQLTSFPSVTLAPLSERSIDTFIENWYHTLERLGYISQQAAHAKASELREAARRLIDLAQNPMLLTVMAVVHTYRGTLPRERARLYNDCVALLLWEWQRAKQLGPDAWEPGIYELLDTREERLINGLCEVAYNAHCTQGTRRGMVNIPQSVVLSTFQRYLDGDWGKAQQFCDYIEKRAGLLVGRGKDKNGDPMYAFPHRGFQEFLAGRFLVAERDFARRVAVLTAEGDTWHEVLLMAIGHLVYNQGNNYPPLDAVNLLCPEKPPEDDTGWRATWWGGEMLLTVRRDVAEQDALVGQQLVPRVIERLVRLVAEGHLTPVERAQAADVLGSLGDPRPGVCCLEPEMVRFEGGPYSLGEVGEGGQVALKPFWLARYPVTNTQFRAFIEDGYRRPRYWTEAGREWRKRSADPAGGYAYDPVAGIANRPVTGITWHEAVAYTNWLRQKTGKPYRLPTEAEWERAAAGLEHRKYPFGNRASDDACNTRECGVGQSTAVGIFPEDKTPEGLYDMGGNVWEWCSTLFKDPPYRPDDGRENLEAPGDRILRGGSYDSAHRQIHCSQQRPVDPLTRVRMIGFRLARDDK